MRCGGPRKNPDKIAGVAPDMDASAGTTSRNATISSRTRIAKLPSKENPRAARPTLRRPRRSDECDPFAAADDRRSRVEILHGATFSSSTSYIFGLNFHFGRIGAIHTHSRPLSARCARDRVNAIGERFGMRHREHVRSEIEEDEIGFEGREEAIHLFLVDGLHLRARPRVPVVFDAGLVVALLHREREAVSVTDHRIADVKDDVWRFFFDDRDHRRCRRRQWRDDRRRRDRASWERRDRLRGRIGPLRAIHAKYKHCQARDLESRAERPRRGHDETIIARSSYAETKSAQFTAPECTRTYASAAATMRSAT